MNANLTTLCICSLILGIASILISKMVKNKVKDGSLNENMGKWAKWLFILGIIIAVFGVLALIGILLGA